MADFFLTCQNSLFNQVTTLCSC